MARCAAATTGAGVGKSGSPISMWITVRPAASSARAAVCTSITWNGAMSATRAARRVRSSIEGRRQVDPGSRYRSVRLPAPHRAIPPVNPAHLVLLAAAALAVPVAGHAALYKCAVDGGSVVYQDTPCPAGRELR